MGAPYQRQDVSNNIANGNIINADDLDAEFNALESAFAATTGHSHDGTSGEGGPITVVGPAQDVIISSTQVLPKTNNTLDLGSASFKFKDAYVDGILYADGITFNGTSITATAAELNKLAGSTVTATELNRLTGVTSNVQTQLDARQPLDAELTAIAGLTSAADRLPYFTGSGTATLATFTAAGRALLDDADNTAQRATLGLGTIATQNAASVTITGGTITGITDLAVADGGTGVSTITGILKGNGTSPFSAAVAGTDFLAPAAIGVTVQAFDADLTAVAGLSTSGLITRTGAGTAATRTLTAGTGISVTNGDGVSGNPTLAVSGNLSSLAGISLVQGDLLYATAADTLVRLPKGTEGQVLRMNTGATAPEWATSGITYATPQASTSGTSIDFTGIPATATRVCVILTGVSVNTTADLRFQLGDSGGIETSGYASSSSIAVGAAIGQSSSTSGFDTNGSFMSATGNIAHGRITFTKVTGDTWVADAVLAGSAPSNVLIAGSKTLSATLDRVRITTVAGTAAFDLGTIGLSWE